MLHQRPDRRDRFTPTGVGTINDDPPRHAAQTVHPHGRGDNERARFDVRRLVGSPPRAWGQSPDRQSSRISVRFTPTGVGTMANQRLSVGYAAVHPHGRGDNESPATREYVAYGSPPRAWGQWSYDRLFQSSLRFTPTGVGTIESVGCVFSASTVHPHGRGDNVWTISVGSGSPRFTPTGVGTILASQAF